jgi:hypothetical protein
MSGSTARSSRLSPTASGSSRERPEIKRTHDDADVADAITTGHNRQQDGDQADRGSVDQRERREPRFQQDRWAQLPRSAGT